MQVFQTCRAVQATKDLPGRAILEGAHRAVIAAASVRSTRAARNPRRPAFVARGQAASRYMRTNSAFCVWRAAWHGYCSMGGTRWIRQKHTPQRCGRSVRKAGHVLKAVRSQNGHALQSLRHNECSAALPQKQISLFYGRTFRNRMLAPKASMRSSSLMLRSTYSVAILSYPCSSYSRARLRNTSPPST